MNELKSLKVKVGGRTLTVFQASFVMNLQRSMAISEAGKSTPEKIYDNLDGQVVTYVHRLLYPSLISCSSGKLPTEAEFLKLPNADVEAWLEAAQQLNPDWFSMNPGQEAVVEKKE